MKMWALNLGKPVNVPPLTEAMAVELGASLLDKQAMKPKAGKLKLEKDELTNRLAEMTFRLERQ
ncbi:Putative OPA3-like protein CG13603, partial [Eumeta japonica]